MVSHLFNYMCMSLLRLRLIRLLNLLSVAVDLKIRKWREKLDTERIISLVTLKQNTWLRLKEKQFMM